MQHNLVRERVTAVVSPFARGIRLAAALVLSTTVMASCKKDDVMNSPVLATITVAPAAVTLAAGATQQFTAVSTDANGNTVTITPVWSVAAVGGGTISATGLFTAGIVTGTFANTVRATSGTRSGTATVSVVAGPLATLTLTPNPASVAAGLTRQFTAVAKDVSGIVITVNRPPVLCRVPEAAGTVGFVSGLFTAGNTPGTYNLTATSGTVTATSAVTVTAGVGAVTDFTLTPSTLSIAAGTTRQFTAMGTDAAGNRFPVTPVYSLSAGGSTISAAGLLTAGMTVGSYILTAANGGITKTVTITVTATAGALATITVTPNPAIIPATTTQQFTAVGRDAAGNTVAIAPVWSLVPPVFPDDTDTISATGLFTAGGLLGLSANEVMARSGTEVVSVF